MSDRRVVRVDDRFFRQLDNQLGSERGPSGEPTATDFLLIELPTVADQFATRFEQLAVPIAESPEYRSILGIGLLVPRFLVTGVLDEDNGVSLIGLQIDLDAGW